MEGEEKWEAPLCPILLAYQYSCFDEKARVWVMHYAVKFALQWVQK
jgi:hypothetical protein